MNLIDALRSKLQQRTTSRAEGYREAVKDAAQDMRIDVEKLADIIEQAGKTPSEFEADVEKQRRRIQLQSAVAKRPEHERRLREAAAEITKLRTDFEAAEAKYWEKRRPLEWNEEGATNAIAQCDRDLQELISMCDDPALIQQQKDLSERQAENSKSRDRLRAAISQRRSRLPSEGGEKLLDLSPHEKAEQERTQNLRKAIAELEQQLREVEEQSKAMEQEYRELQQQKALA